MLNKFITIKWFNPNTSLWITDYIHDDDKEYCIVSFEETEALLSKRKCNKLLELDSTHFSFIISKNIVQDILNVLNKAMNTIYKTDYIRVINLGFICKNDLITGSFSIKIIEDNNVN